MDSPINTIVNGAVGLFKAYFPPDLTPKQKATMEANAIAIEAHTRALVTNSVMAMEQEVTKRAQADMQSDSWLSKNVRPIVLIYLLFLYTIFSGLSAYLHIDVVYVDMLKSMLTDAFGFYFAGRTIEKVTSILRGK